MLEVSEPHLLDRYTPEVFRAYVVSRLESVSVVLREGCDDPLEDLTVVNQQLDQVSCRLEALDSFGIVYVGLVS